MAFNITFVKSKQFKVWIAINVIFPTFMIGLIRQIDVAMTLDLSMILNNIIVVSSVLLMIFANIYYAKLWRNTTVFKYFIGIVFLNIIAFFVAGSISFITSFSYLQIPSDTFIIHYGILTEAQKL